MNFRIQFLLMLLNAFNGLKLVLRICGRLHQNVEKQTKEHSILIDRKHKSKNCFTVAFKLYRFIK